MSGGSASRPFIFALALTFAPAFALTVARTASAAPQAASAAREVAKQGYELKLQKRWAPARDKFAESLRLDPLPKTLINLAECEAELGKLIDAEQHLVDARDRTGNDAELNGIAVARLAVLEKRMPRLTIHIAVDAPPDTVVTLDDVVLNKPSLDTVLPTDPGMHAVVARAAGRTERRWDISLDEAETKGVEVGPGPAPNAAAAPVATPAPRGPADTRAKSRPWHTVSFVVMGVGAAGVGLGTVLAVLAATEKCPNNRCFTPGAKSDHLAAKSKADIATVAFVAGGALLAGGGVLWLLTSPSKDKRSSNASSLDVGVGLGSLSLSKSW